MNIISRTITGSVMLIGGFFLILLSLFHAIFLLIYGIPLFIIGLIIFFNKKEDVIEEINKNERRVKK